MNLTTAIIIIILTSVGMVVYVNNLDEPAHTDRFAKSMRDLRESFTSLDNTIIDVMRIEHTCPTTGNK